MRKRELCLCCVVTAVSCLLPHSPAFSPASWVSGAPPRSNQGLDSTAGERPKTRKMAEPDKLNIDSIIQRLLEGKMKLCSSTLFCLDVYINAPRWWKSRCTPLFLTGAQKAGLHSSFQIIIFLFFFLLILIRLLFGLITFCLVQFSNIFTKRTFVSL